MRKFILVAGLLADVAGSLRAQDSSSIARDSTHARLLAEVTVTTHGPTIRNGPERKVFAVNQSLVSLGGTAADLLQNVPTLQVDANGNLSLRGATNLKVLVDGKRSLIGGGTIAQVLQSIPASSIDRIEIITNPSAKYDAEGEALVNIILKKNTAAGLNGSAAVTGGTRDNYNAAASISNQKGRINWYGNYSYQHRNTYSNGFQDMTYLVPQPEAVYYSNETFPSVTITDLHSAKAGVDIVLGDAIAGTARDELSVSGAYNASTTGRKEWLTVDNLTAADLPVQLIKQYNGITGNGNSYELTVDYTHKFRKPQKELDVDFDYARGLTNNRAIYNTDDSASVLKDSKYALSRNYNIQLDYTTPVGKAGKLETGYRSQIGTADNRQLDDEVGNNLFKSTSQVHALYLNFRREMGTVELQLGMRGELGRFNAQLQSYDSAGQLVMEPIRVNTQGLYPSLLVIKHLGEGRQIQLSYSRRVNRPTPRELNPFFDVSDPVNYDAGNPRLLPESIHTVELTYSRTWTGVSLNVGGYFTQVNDVIKHIQTVPVDDVVYTISENLNRAINTGLEFIGNFHPMKAWDFTANVNLFERINDGDSAFGISATHGLSWNVNLTNNFSLARNLALQVRADYKASELIIQDRYRPTYGLDGALRYDFWHRKGSLALNGRDIFNTRRWTFLREDETLLLNFQRVTYSARASLTFTYHFGGGGSGGGAKKGVEVQQDKRIENR
jgi:ferric enterobactin receptor